MNATISTKSTIVDTWNSLMQPGQVVELRVLKIDGKKRTDSGYFDNPYDLAEAAARYNGRSNVYLTPNGVERSLLARACNKMKEWAAEGDTTSDLYIERRYWLLIDTDPSRASGISATEEEHRAALDRAAAIREWLTSRGWPDPIVADSGNGGHLNYRIDQPNTPESTLLIKSCLQALALYFDDDRVSVDTGNFNAARIWKLYGTMAVKGDDTSERPHRLSKILSVPEPTQIVTGDQLQSLAALLPPAEPAPASARANGRYTGEPFDLEAWLAKHNITGQKAAWNSGTRWRLDQCPFSTAHDDGAFVVKLANGAIAAGCKHNSCQGKNWHTLREIYDGPKEERSLKVHVNGSSKKAATANVETESKRLTWQDYSQATDALGYSFRMNDLDDTLEVNGKRLCDGIEAEIFMRMADIGLSKAEWVKRAYTATAHQNRYNPIVDFLNGLQWDGKDWIAEFERYVWDKHPKIAYANGEIIPVFGAWLRRWGIGAVAKVLKTGKVRGQNYVLTLAGPQNVGKSTLARFLCPMSDDFFIESHIDPDSSDHLRYMATKLCWEVAELGATTRKADREALKSFLTRQDCTFRTPYAHHPVTKPAVTSFIGTINPENGFLNDPTGHRRFLPVEIAKIDFSYIEKINNIQLWAQFVALYRAGVSMQLTMEENRMANAIREEHETEDGYAGFIAKYYDIDPARSDWIETTNDIVDLLSVKGVAGVNVTNVGLSLRRLGLERKRETTGRKLVFWRGIRRASLAARQE